MQRQLVNSKLQEPITVKIIQSFIYSKLVTQAEKLNENKTGQVDK